jgi:hypothetical protein
MDVFIGCMLDVLMMMYGRHDTDYVTDYDTVHDTAHDSINVLMLYWNVFIFIFYCYYVWICYFNVVSLYYD